MDVAIGVIQIHINSSRLLVVFTSLYGFKEHENTQIGTLLMSCYFSKIVYEANTLSIFYRK